MLPTGAIRAISKKSAIAFLFLMTIGANVAAEDEVRYIFARKISDVDLAFVVNGKSFNEQELRLYFKRNAATWPKEETELRIVFDGNVPISWWNHSRRTFRFLGFDNVRCYGGNLSSGRAVEIREVGPSITLPDQRW